MHVCVCLYISIYKKDKYNLLILHFKLQGCQRQSAEMKGDLLPRFQEQSQGPRSQLQQHILSLHKQEGGAQPDEGRK